VAKLPVHVVREMEGVLSSYTPPMPVDIHEFVQNGPWGVKKMESSVNCQSVNRNSLHDNRKEIINDRANLTRVGLAGNMNGSHNKSVSATAWNSLNSPMRTIINDNDRVIMTDAGNDGVVQLEPIVIGMVVASANLSPAAFQRLMTSPYPMMFVWYLPRSLAVTVEMNEGERHQVDPLGVVPAFLVNDAAQVYLNHVKMAPTNVRWRYSGEDYHIIRPVRST
jgi:hypothetical protein